MIICYEPLLRAAVAYCNWQSGHVLARPSASVVPGLPGRLVDCHLMRYALQYQYKGPGDKRPEDYGQENDVTINEGEPLVVPDLSDSVMACTRASRFPRFESMLCLIWFR